MFANALKSISATPITGGYSISSTPISTAGAWKIHRCKKKSTGKSYSVFIFDRKTLDSSHSSSFGSSSRSVSAAAAKKAADEVVERLKKEAAALARLRHPNILELVEPVEETRGGGLQFVTEEVVGSLKGLLDEKEESERSGGSLGGGRSRYGGASDDGDGQGGRRKREIELDELEIQKGLLQVSKALEFLHEMAGLVHGNLTPDAIIVNAKSDWKISGLAFCSPAANSDKPTSFQSIALHEVLNPDPRLPRQVQLNIDFTSPDFVLDNNITSAADMFSLGILCVSLYNLPHKSPLEAHGSLSSYKRIFASSTIPTLSNNYLSSKPIPKELATLVLPKLIARRPAQRMTAKEFQLSEYFDNVLVSTIRFLDAFPAKTPTEKSSFMRGLTKVLPSFPRSVMEKKILPALTEELKDKELLSLILQNILVIVELLPTAMARRVFADRVRPALREIFITNNRTAVGEKDPLRDAGLRMVLEHMECITANCNGKEFKDDILPIYMLAIDSSTPPLVGFSLESLSSILPVLDFSTIKNELFPIIAAMFSRTVSLAIKVAGLKAFVVLCGGSLTDSDPSDDLSGVTAKKATSSALDKYTMQEKIVPLIKQIKTKEPMVMMGALKVLEVIGEVADAEFVAMEILPILWTMSLGPLLNISQFSTFMEKIKHLSKRVEDEQRRKLQELSGTSDPAVVMPGEDFLGFGGVSGTQFDNPPADPDDFERLVKGRSAPVKSPSVASWDDPAPTMKSPVAGAVSQASQSAARSSTPPTFSWSTPLSVSGTLKAAGAEKTRLASFAPLAPSSTQFSKPLAPTVLAVSMGNDDGGGGGGGGGVWGAAPMQAVATGMGGLSMGGSPWAGMTGNSAGVVKNNTESSSGFSLPPPPGAGVNSVAKPNYSGLGMGMGGGSDVRGANSSMTPATPMNSMGSGMMSLMPMNQINTMGQRPGQAQQQTQGQQKTGGLDMYQSLL